MRSHWAWMTYGTRRIVFGSTTGNTENTAERIGGVLAAKSFYVNLQNVSDTTLGDEADFDVVLFGCSTWGEEEIELQGDFIDYCEVMVNAPFKGKKVGSFGCGESSFLYFCGAVDAIEDNVKTIGGVLVEKPSRLTASPMMPKVILTTELSYSQTCFRADNTFVSHRQDRRRQLSA